MLDLMLASPGGSRVDRDPAAAIAGLQASGDWMFEPKYDGVRARVEVAGGRVAVTSRQGHDITRVFPDVVGPLTGFDVDVVLDGEIICVVGGRPDFGRALKRVTQSTARVIAGLAVTMPANLVVFDVVDLAGQDLRRLSYDTRHARLVELGLDLAARAVRVTPADADGGAMWAQVVDRNLEGLVAKRRSSIYRPVRSPNWVKIKRKRRGSVLVGGYTRGEGVRASTFGALEMRVLSNGALVDVGQVGAGFSELDIRRVWARLTAGDHPIVIEVEYLEISSGQQLRQPVFKGVRTDVSAMDCTLERLQLG